MIRANLRIDSRESGHLRGVLGPSFFVFPWKPEKAKFCQFFGDGGCRGPILSEGGIGRERKANGWQQSLIAGGAAAQHYQLAQH